MELDIQTALSTGDLSAAVFLMVFVTGLLTSLTPCVYPLLPISVTVVGRAARSRVHAFYLAVVYTLGVALVYALLGVLAAFTGQLFGAVASHPLTLATMALICLGMAVWMLGWIHLPTLSTGTDAPQKYTGPASLFVAGALSGLVMAPCTSPVLGMLLMYVAARGAPVSGGALMFVFAFGMSALLVAAGTFSGLLTTLPRAGRWMSIIKTVLALLMGLAGVYLALLSWQNL